MHCVCVSEQRLEVSSSTTDSPSIPLRQGLSLTPGFSQIGWKPENPVGLLSPLHSKET